MENFVQFGNRSTEMTVTSSTFEQVMDLIFPEPSQDCKTTRGWTMRQNKKDALWNCYNADDVRPYHGTAWGIINAVADYESHVRTKNVEISMGHALNGNMKLLQKTVEFLRLGDKA